MRGKVGPGSLDLPELHHSSEERPVKLGLKVILGKVSLEKAAVLLDSVQMRRGEEGRAPPKFVGTFSLVHFWSTTGVKSPQNANSLSFELFF